MQNRRFTYTAFMIALLISVGALSLLSACTCNRSSKSSNAPDGSAGSNETPDYSGITVARVLTTEVAPGNGATAKEGSTVSGSYSLWVYDPRALGNKGKLISKTEDGKPVTFTIGKGETIKGLEQGVIGMKEGGTRSVIIPVELGYGAKGTDSVPPGAILLAEFTLVKAR